MHCRGGIVVASKHDKVAGEDLVVRSHPPISTSRVSCSNMTELDNAMV